jgi:acetate kinase
MDIDNNSYILTVNAGSSSIKFGLFTATDNARQLLYAEVVNIGKPIANFSVKGELATGTPVQEVAAANHQAAAKILIDYLLKCVPAPSVAAVGHRLVHGGPNYFEPRLIEQPMIEDLRRLTVFDPEHLPVELQLIGIFQQMFPAAKHVACFDTAFHRDLPVESRILPIPRRYEAQGVRRYGFHGLSYTYVMSRLAELGDESAASGRVILAHLGSGVSLAAVRGGKSIDTTMGLTPAAGVPMSTRSGDLDPGVALYLARSEGLDVEGFYRLVNFQSGLLGVSGITPDMKELLEKEETDSRASDAVRLFCYQVKKAIGGLSAALGGLDTLVFCGGMAENAPKIRARVCEGLEYLGINIDETRNLNADNVISADSSRVNVRIIHTDESVTIVRSVLQLIKEAV